MKSSNPHLLFSDKQASPPQFPVVNTVEQVSRFNQTSAKTECDFFPPGKEKISLLH